MPVKLVSKLDEIFGSEIDFAKRAASEEADAVVVSREETPIGKNTGWEKHKKDQGKAEEIRDLGREHRIVDTIFSNNDSTPYMLDKALIDKYKVEWMAWEPETIKTMIKKDYHSEVTQINLEKVLAARLVHTSDAPFRDFDVFEKVVICFNNITPNFFIYEETTPAQLYYAMSQMSRMRVDEHSLEVVNYIALMCKNSGLLYLPGPLAIAQEKLDKIIPANAKGYKSEIRERWELVKDAYRGYSFIDDIYGIQMTRLAGIDLYYNHMSKLEK